MSRQTNIDVSVKTSSAITGIRNLKKAFEQLNETVKQTIGKDETIKVKVDFGGVDINVLKQFSGGLRTLNKQLNEYEANLTKLNQTGTTVNLVQNKITNNIKKTGEQADITKKQIVGYATATATTFRFLSSTAKDLMKLTDSTYALGVAGQMNLGTIAGLNEEFSKMSANIPVTALGLSEAVNNLIRTGRSFEESKEIIKQVAMLSVATGDNLAESAQIATKVMVALDVNASKTTETLNTMHSTAITTASDMKYLAEAFKNVAGTASVLVKSSGRSGEELDKYKQDVLDLTMAMTGSLANLGLSASNAGTKIKVLFSKLSAGEKSARALFDEAMRVNDIRIDGELFNFDKLAEVTRTDLPRAVELMSELYTQGTLSTNVMQKMFTGRHFMEASNLFLQVNGNVKQFTDSITKNNDYLTDYYKNMFNINNQFQQFVNNIKAVNTTASGSFLDGITGSLALMNQLLTSANNGDGALPALGKAILDIGAGTAQIGALAISVGVLTKGFVLAKTAMLALSSAVIANPIGAVIAGVATTILLINGEIQKTKKYIFDVNSAGSEMEKKFENARISLEKSSGLLKRFHATIKEINSEEIISTSSIDIIKGFLSNGSGFMEMLEGFETMNKFDVSALQKQEQTSMLNNAKKEYDELLDTRNKLLKAVQDEYNLEVDKTVVHQDFNQRLKRLMAFYVDLNKINATAEQKSVAMEKKRQELHINSYNMRLMISKFEKSYLNEMDKQIDEQMQRVQLLEARVADSINEILNKQTENQKRRGQIIADTTKTQVDMLQRFGKVQIGKNQYAGVEALVALTKDMSLGSANNTLQQIANEIESIDLIVAEITKGKDEISTKDKESLARLKEERAILETRHANELKNLEYRKQALAGINAQMFKGIEYSNQSKELMMEILSITASIAEAEKKGQPEKIIAPLRENLAQKKMLLSLIDKESKMKEQAKVKDTTYQIKYKNYLKESLALELESLKIGRTKGEQEILAYNYKLRQFELDKKIALMEVEATKATLKSLNMESAMREKINRITNVQEGQKFIDEFYAKNKNVLKGTTGEAHKNIYEAVNSYVNALSKAEGVAQQIELLPITTLRKNLDELPSLIKASLESLQGLADSGLTPYNNYGQKIVDGMMESFKDNKDRVFNAYGIIGDSISRAITENLSEIDVLKALQGNLEGVTQFIADMKAKLANNPELANQLTITGDVKKDYSNVLEFLIEKNKDLNDLSREGVSIEEQKLKVIEAQLSVVKTSGDLLSKLGQVTGMKGLSQLGSTLNAIKDYEVDMSKVNIDWGEIFAGSNLQENLSQVFSGALAGVNMGSGVGGLVGSITGGGQSAQAGGALGGMLAGALGLAGGPAGMAIAAGASLVAGFFDKNDENKAKDEKRTKEANAIYNANTEALQKLSQNMTSLSGGVDGLNNTLISAFSKIPTIDNIGNVTSAMKDLYKTMEKTRIFESASYQVVKHKSGSSGFLGVGASADRTWTETYSKSVESLLAEYDIRKDFDTMTSSEIREFAEWVKKYKKGDSSNFNVLGEALAEYAHSLDKMEKNIENFFRDTTMEAFQGISSLQQEDLRKQIEDFYKNLGLTMDKEVQEEIDKLAEEMSVMVTIMHDVRGEFLKSWRETGMSAGKVFLSSMTPYIDAVLGNISQLYYDVFFSGINSQMEKEFKNLSEQLVELKRQGADLDWSKVTDTLYNSFDKVLSNIEKVKGETESFNQILLELQNQALNAGLSLSEIFELGLMSGTQREVMETFKSVLTSDDDAVASIGDMLGQKIGDAMSNKLIDNLLSDKVLEFSSQIDKVMSGNMGFDSLSEIANQSLQIGLMMESERLRLEAIRDMFDFNSDIEYTTQNEEIKYDSGTSQNITQIFNVATNLEVSNLVESDSIDRLASDLLETMIDKLRDKGIVLS